MGRTFGYAIMAVLAISTAAHAAIHPAAAARSGRGESAGSVVLAAALPSISMRLVKPTPTPRRAGVPASIDTSTPTSTPTPTATPVWYCTIVDGEEACIDGIPPTPRKRSSRAR